MNYTVDMIKWPEGTTEKQKSYIMAMLQDQAEKKMMVCVGYTPNCGCPIIMDVILDRYPMSKKIHSKCPQCNKWVLLEIYDPLQFFTPWDKKTHSLEELKDMVITEGSKQASFLIAYQGHKEKKKRKSAKSKEGES